jgi:phosphoenolpyruvate-protein phosphotransferase (PTS system enzyme I)
MKMNAETTPAGAAIMLFGTPISAGIALGDAFVLKPINLSALETNRFPVQDAEKEIERLERTIQTTHAQLTEIAQLLHHDSNAADIMEVQKSFLSDGSFLHEIKADVHREKINIEYLLSNRIKMLEEKFRTIEDELVRTRILDIQDVYHRILRNLLDIDHVRSNPLKRVRSPVLLVAERLLPSDIALLEYGKLLGIILEEGNKLSHVSIMTKSLGIPAVIGIHGICSLVKTGQALILDAIKGRVAINPSRTQTAHYNRARNRLSSICRIRERHQPLECKTIDGSIIAFEANVATLKEAEDAMKHRAKGIGLLRSEFFYLSRPCLPAVQEECDFYVKIIKTMKQRPVTIRLLDTGADKTLPCLPPFREENPQLGLRGIRYLLAHPDLFNNHLRAIVRAAQTGPVRLLVPFVTTVEDVVKTLSLLSRLCTEEKTARDRFRIGIMVEIPAVALYPHCFFPFVDFINIGTNDLVQYLFAADRAEGAVEPYRQNRHPAVFRILAHCIAAAEKHKKEVTLCGEIASDPAIAPLLAGLGATRFSMPPSAIPAMRDAMSRSSMAILKKQAKSALAFKETVIQKP